MAIPRRRTRSRNVNGQKQNSSHRPRSAGSGFSSSDGSFSWNHHKSHCVALDCEMVGVLSGESVAARVVLVNGNGNIIFDAYVKPEETITDYRTFVSGVTEEDLERHGKPFAVVRSQVLALLKGKILVGHALSNDLNCLRINHPWFMQRDTAYYQPFMQTRESRDGAPILLPRKLRDLALEKLGRYIQVPGRPHCPAEDAIAALDLYLFQMHMWEQYVTEAVLYQQHQQMRYRRHYTASSAAPRHVPHHYQYVYGIPQQVYA